MWTEAVPLGRVARVLYNHNPFYIISSGCILYGLQTAFENSPFESNSLLLASGIIGYSIVLAITAFLIVRLGRVWEDARSLLVVLVLQLLALSVSFDELCHSSAQTSAAFLVGGLGFASLFSELVLRCLRIQLPWSYRLPYHQMLTLFFLYPLFVSPAVNGMSTGALQWRVFAFPAFAGLVFLSLVPAIRQGKSATSPNGTPWKWPLMPWTLFVVIAIGVLIRSYALSLSFVPLAGLNSTFAICFLIPFFLSLLILFVELGKVELPGFEEFAVVLSWLLLPLAAIDLTSRHVALLDDLSEYHLHPIGVTAILVALFNLYAKYRGAKCATFGFALSCLAITVSPLNTIERTWQVYQTWPLILLLGFFAVESIRRRSLTGAAVTWTLSCGLLLLCVNLPGGRYQAAALGLQVWLLGMLVFGNLMNNDAGRRLCFVMLGITTGIAFTLNGAGLGGFVAPLVPLGYSVCGLILVACHSRWLVHLPLRRILFFQLTNSLFALVGVAHVQIAHVAGGNSSLAIEAGVLCFIVASLISAGKGGALHYFGLGWQQTEHIRQPLERIRDL